MHNDGPAGFFLGLTTTIAREIPGYFCFFGAYELCRSLFADYMHCGKDDIGMETLILPLVNDLHNPDPTQRYWHNDYQHTLFPTHW